MKRTYKNPILSGWHPDPSICETPEGFWMVNSSFEYFPGLPLYFSKDLVNWEQIGFVLDRESQLPLTGVRNNQGLFAPTIRWNKGTFYVVCTLVNENSGNFIVTSTDPAKGWSEPHWIKDAPGIDPSLLFDDDGKCWYVGQRTPETFVYEGNSEIWLQEIDITRMQLIGEKTVIWTGAVKNSVWAEGPHLYKIDGMYYAFVSEGGTDFEHSISVAKSSEIRGPYVGCKRNPVFTHRNLGQEFPIACAGHSDLICTKSGEWWMVMLAVRLYGGYHYNLGRETFLAPVKWEDGWPVICPGIGHLPFEAVAPDLAACVVPQPQTGFGNTQLTAQWQMLVRGLGNRMRLENGILELQACGENLTKTDGVNFISRKQQHINFIANCELTFNPLLEDSAAGFCVYQDVRHHIRIEANKGSLCVIRTQKGEEKIIGTKTRYTGPLKLTVSAQGQLYCFEAEGKGIKLRVEQDGRLLAPMREYGLGFTGTMIGVYANGSEAETWARFSDFHYREVAD